MIVFICSTALPSAFSDGIFTDPKKAFDTINHIKSILIKKFQSYYV